MCHLPHTLHPTTSLPDPPHPSGHLSPHLPPATSLYTPSPHPSFPSYLPLCLSLPSPHAPHPPTSPRNWLAICPLPTIPYPTPYPPSPSTPRAPSLHLTQPSCPSHQPVFPLLPTPQSADHPLLPTHPSLHSLTLSLAPSTIPPVLPAPHTPLPPPTHPSHPPPTPLPSAPCLHPHLSPHSLTYTSPPCPTPTARLLT